MVELVKNRVSHANWLAWEEEEKVERLERDMQDARPRGMLLALHMAQKAISRVDSSTLSDDRRLEGEEPPPMPPPQHQPSGRRGSVVPPKALEGALSDHRLFFPDEVHGRRQRAPPLREPIVLYVSQSYPPALRASLCTALESALRKALIPGDHERHAGKAAKGRREKDFFEVSTCWKPGAVPVLCLWWSGRDDEDGFFKHADLVKRACKARPSPAAVATS